MAGESVNDKNKVNESIQCSSKGKRLTSNVWNHMEREVLDNGDVKATCNYCKLTLSAKSKSGTTHLSRHVESCSVRRYRDLKGFVISGSSSASNSSSIPEQISLRKPVVSLEDIRYALSVFIVSGGHAFHLVEEPGFVYLMRVLAPDFHLVSRFTIKRDAMVEYGKEKLKIHQELQDAPGRISFTTDNWKSENTADEFMCLTAHWVDIDWVLQKRIIKFASLTPPFDGASLAEEILFCLGEWKIANKAFTITLDNASYNDTMMTCLKSHLLRKHSLVAHGEFFQMRCCCHIINLVVQAGLKLIDDVVVKIRKVVISVRNSIQKNKRFYEIATTNFGLSSTKRLRLDTPTRWNSTYTMLDRFLYFQDVIDSFVAKDVDLKAYWLSLADWEIVREIHGFLHIFYVTTTEFSASKTPTSNIYFRGVWSIHMHLTSVNESAPVLYKMVKPMQDKFEKYWAEYNLLLSCAAVLDPRYKLEAVNFCYTSLFGETYAEEMIRRIKDVFLELIRDYTVVKEKADDEPCVSSESELLKRKTSYSTSVGSQRVALDPQALLLNHLSMNKKQKTILKSELDMYLEDENECPSTNLDILNYWKRKSRRFPVLSALARDILAIPISSVPSESSFSLGNKMITSSRSSLASTTIEALSCYEDWLRVKGFVKGPSKTLKIGDVDYEDDEEEVIKS